LIPLRAELRLDPALGNLDGHFAMDVGAFEPRIEDGPEYETLRVSDIDTPPRAIRRVNPLYPPRARMRRIQGHVQVEFVVGIDGKVRSVEVTDSIPEGVFDAAALRAVKQWQFKPGAKGGQPVPVRVRQNVQFTLER
jgi:protein TonB